MDEDNLYLAAFGNRLCDICKNLRFPLESGFQRHIHGYDQLVLRAARCELCNLVCQGLRREFVATSTTSMAHNNMTLIDKQITASVIIDDNNPFLPGIPGWVAIQSRGRSAEDKCSVYRESFAGCIDVCVSPRAQCTLLIFKYGATVRLRDDKNHSCCVVDAPVEGTSPGWGLGRLYHARSMICEDTGYMQGKADKPLPSRIIDVGHDWGSSFSGPIRLVEPERRSHGVYLTLSHRWGSSRHITTTRSNIAAHRKCIPWQNLPQTFKEAITVCHVMHVRYLWIDSLCIIQDDTAEWKRESRLMGDIYHNGLCTIASHAANGDEEGFLASLSPKQRVIMRGKGNSAFEVSISSYFSRDIACDSAISWRGWVLQERLLSTKILHFLPSQLYLESTGSYPICINTGTLHYVDTAPCLVSVLRKENLAQNWYGIVNLAQNWHGIVEWYSRCALTKETDKLPALSGIANIFQRKFRLHYLAGLWCTHEFSTELLWLSVDGSRSKRPQTQRASTWSWASLDGAVAYVHVEQKRKQLHLKLQTIGGSLIGPNLERLYQEIGWNSHNDAWVEKPVPLHFSAQIAKLPQLGHCSEASYARATGSHAIKHILSEYAQLSISLFRSILLSGDTVGLVVMDVESDRLPDPDSLLYIPLASSSRSHIILVVSLDSQRGNVYKRVGLGFLCTSILKEDGTYCSLSEVLEELRPRGEREEIVLI